MDNQIYHQQAIEIDLKDIIWKLLTQWKAILLVSLIMALMACGAKHMKDVKSYNAQIAAQNETADMMSLSIDEQISKVMETLPEEDRASVNLIISEKEWLASQNDYINNSVLMKTDSTNQRVLKLMFDIDSEQKSELPVLLHNYAIYQYSNEVISAIRPLIDENAEDKYIGELFYIDEEKAVESEIEETGAVLDINLVLPEDVDAEAIVKAINTVFVKHSGEIQVKYPHSISLAGSEVQNFYHRRNVEKHTSIFTTVNNLDNTIKTNESLLSDSQAAAVRSIMAIKNNKSIAEEAEAEALEKELQAPSWSKKYALIGFLLGVGIYALAYVALLFFNGTLLSTENVEKHTKARLLGEIYYNSKDEGIYKLFRSRAIEKLRHCGKTDSDKQMDIIINSLDAILDRSGSKTAALLNAAGGKNDEGLDSTIRSLARKTQEKDIVLNIVDVSDHINEKEFLNMDKAVVAVSDNTKIQHLEKLMSICGEYNILQIGSIFIGKQ